MRLAPALCLAASVSIAAAAPLPETGIVYGDPGTEPLTLDYYQPAGPAPHPAVILIHGGGFTSGTSRNGSEAYCAQFLAPAGYAVFAINYRLAPRHPFPAAVEDVQRAVRFVRHSASRWGLDPNRIALVGGSAGGYLSNMAGILDGRPSKSPDPVERVSAAVQAVVTLFGPSDFRGQPVSKNLLAFLGRLIEENGAEAALAEASPVMHIRLDAPPFLFIHGDSDDTVPLVQSTHFQLALQEAGIASDLIVIGNGGHGTGRWHTIPGIRDWEAEMVAWLNETLQHRGPIGAGIRARQPGTLPR